MSNKKGLFSWFKKDKPETEVEIEKNQSSISEPAEHSSDTTHVDAAALQNTTNENNDTVQNLETELQPSQSQIDDSAQPIESVIAANNDISVPERTDLETTNLETSEPVNQELALKLAESTSSHSAELEITPQAQTHVSDDLASVEPQNQTNEQASATESSNQKQSFFTRLKQGLSKTSQNLGGGIFDLFRDKKIDEDLFEELETQLLLADVGIETTMKIIDSLTESASRKQLKDAEALYDLLKLELEKIVLKNNKPETTPVNGPQVILMVGVNGVGKTTTIGKLAKQFQAQGKSVMLAAGDTFRAAAVEQLQVWGERNDIPVVAQHTGADSASVIFDAINSAKSKGVDVLIADTAGRLQNKAHLMEELIKVVRVMKKIDVDAPHEVLLTIDAGTGQNAISQTKLFDEAVGLTGINVTKLDGTAKGGVIFAIADKFDIPIRYLGVGEGIDDLRPFVGKDFVTALFEKQG